MITKEMIKKGFEQNIISIENECYGCINICCKIGDNAFYFVGMEDEISSEQKPNQEEEVKEEDEDASELTPVGKGKNKDKKKRKK